MWAPKDGGPKKFGVGVFVRVGGGRMHAGGGCFSTGLPRHSTVPGLHSYITGSHVQWLPTCKNGAKT